MSSADNSAFGADDLLVELSATLRSLHARSGMTQTAAAAAVGVSPSTVTRWQHPDPRRATAPTEAQLRALAEPYSMTPTELVRTLELKRAIDDIRFPSLADVLSRSDKMQMRIAQVERSATDIRTYFPMTIPGTLQTESYMRTLFEGAGIDDSEKIEGSITARMSRRALIDGTRRYTVIITEASLYWCLGSREIMREQCERIASTVLPNYRLGIIPLGTPSPTLSTPHGFDLYTGEDWAEAIGGTLYGTGHATLSDPALPEITRAFTAMEALATWGDAVNQLADRAALFYRSPSGAID